MKREILQLKGEGGRVGVYWENGDLLAANDVELECTLDRFHERAKEHFNQSGHSGPKVRVRFEGPMVDAEMDKIVLDTATGATILQERSLLPVAAIKWTCDAGGQPEVWVKLHGHDVIMDIRSPLS